MNADIPEMKTEIAQAETRPGLRRRRRLRREQTGREPVAAYSALGLRMVLSALALPVFLAAAVLFAIWADSSGSGDSPGMAILIAVAAVCSVVAAAAAVDLVVIGRRRRRERRPLR